MYVPGANNGATSASYRQQSEQHCGSTTGCNGYEFTPCEHLASIDQHSAHYIQSLS
jgi:hypothetical protein